MDDDILKGDQQRMVLRAEADYYSPVIHVNDDDIHLRRTVTAATDRRQQHFANIPSKMFIKSSESVRRGRNERTTSGFA